MSAKNSQIQNQFKCYAQVTTSSLKHQFHATIYHSIDQTHQQFIVSSYNLSIQYSYNLKTLQLTSRTCKMTRTTQGVSNLPSSYQNGLVNLRTS